MTTKKTKKNTPPTNNISRYFPPTHITMDMAIHNLSINQTGWRNEDSSENHLYDSNTFTTEMSRTNCRKTVIPQTHLLHWLYN